MSTNQQFADKDEVFRRACQLAGIQPTKRQAAKWRSNHGRAHEFRRAALEVLEAQNGTPIDMGYLRK